MPIHDWTRVRANRFHDFHQGWTIAIRNALNAGVLPTGYFAMAEQITGGPEPDVVTLSLPTAPDTASVGGLAIADTPPKVAVKMQSDATMYARKANRVSVRNPDGDVVAVIEIVSPGNKDSRHALRSFTRKAVEFLHAGIHLLIVDLFPPSRRDPQGIHQAIWERIHDVDYAAPKGKPLTLAAYSSGTTINAYIEPFGVGDDLIDMPVFLTADRYVLCQLERNYQETWNVFPAALKGPLESPSA